MELVLSFHHVGSDLKSSHLAAMLSAENKGIKGSSVYNIKNLNKNFPNERKEGKRQ